MVNTSGRTVIIVVLLGLMLIFTSCRAVPSPTQTSSPSTKLASTTTPTPSSTVPAGSPYGELKLGLSTLGADNFDPVRSAGAAIATIMGPVYEWNLRIEGGNLKPHVVDKWEVAADGLSWTYYIRKGIKFHNGEDLTAADVKFSKDQYMRGDAFYRDTKTMVDRVEVLDEYTVRIFTKGKQPFLPFTEYLSTGFQGIAMPKDYIEARGYDYFVNHPIGSGPYRVVRWVPGDMAQYEAVDKHWRETAAFKTLSIVLIPEETTRVAGIKTGELDMTELGPDNAVLMESAGFRTFVVDEISPMVGFWGVYDKRAAGMPIADVRVRKALSLAINRDEIRKNFFSGKAGPPFIPFFYDTSDDLDVAYWQKYSENAYRYDPQEAARLLKEAGYPNGINLQFYTFPMSAASFLPKLSEVIQSYWAKVNVKTELIPIEQGIWSRWRPEPADPLVGRASVLRWRTGTITAKQLESSYKSGGTYNILSKAFPEVDRIISDTVSEMDPTKRKEMVAQVLKIVNDTYVWFQICSTPATGVAGPRVDFSSWPSPLPVTYLPPFVSSLKHRQ